MSNKPKRKRSKVWRGEHITYLGKCSQLTRAGDPCGHYVIYANGKCSQHGGTTPGNKREWTPEGRAKFEEMKHRVQKQFDRFNKRLERKKGKWRVGLLNIPGAVRASPAPGIYAAPSKSSAPRKGLSAANGMAVCPPAPRQQKESSEHSPISPAGVQQQAKPDPSRISSSPQSIPKQSSAPLPADCGLKAAKGGQPLDASQPVDSITVGLTAKEAKSADKAKGTAPGVEQAHTRTLDSDPAPTPGQPTYRRITFQEWCRGLVRDAELQRFYGPQAEEYRKLYPSPAAVEPRTHND